MSEWTLPTASAVERLGYAYETEAQEVFGARLHRLCHLVSGLRISWMQLPGRARKQAAFVVPFGSRCRQFETREGTRTLPFGVAHYLEHCMFSRGLDGGLMARFHDLGISANAYTTYTHTQFDFQTVDHFSDGLVLYAKALFQPRLDAERVEAERQIILAERSMYEDEPESRLYLQLTRNLFDLHGLREDICGDPEDIMRIRLEDLTWVTEHFYRPECVELFLAGSFDFLQTLEALAPILTEQNCEEHLLGQTGLLANLPAQPRLILPDESRFPQVHETVSTAPISNPLFAWGIKDHTLRQASSEDRVRWESILHAYASALLGEAGPVFQRLYEKEWLNDTFSWMFYQDDAVGLALFQGESRYPQEAVSALQEAWREGLTHPEQLEENWACEQRAELGRLWMSLDSVGACNAVQIRARLAGMDAPQWLNLRRSVVPQDLHSLSHLASSAWQSIVYMNRE